MDPPPPEPPEPEDGGVDGAGVGAPTVYTTLDVALFPAASTDVTLNVCDPALSVAKTPPDGTPLVHEATPESESEHPKDAFKVAPSETDAPFVGDEIDMEGGVRSMSSETAAIRLVLPARSMQLPLARCALPSVLTWTVALQLARPAPPSESVPAKLTVTGSRNQPAAFGMVDSTAVAVGGCRSMLMSVMSVDPVLPATSVQLPPAL